MGTSALSLRNIAFALLAAIVLALGLIPAWALAEDSPSSGSEGGIASSSNAPVPTLASTMAQEPTAFVSSDVVLDDGAEPVVGSFTVDGMTFALVGDGAMLVSVSQQAMASQDVPGSGVGPELAPGEGDEAMAVIPSTVAYDGVEYPVTAIGPYAFYLSGATEVSLPASIASVDDRAFRSSDVAWAEVDPANQNYASFDGALYSADLSSLLLIPEGRAGSVSIPCEAEVITPGAFSHCSLVTSISVDGDGAAFASWDGLLYDATGTTLLRVPAGTTDIAIREGCTTIAAGAMEGCAKLESIEAPASVTSISPEASARESSTVSPPATSLLEGSDEEEGASSSQLVAMVPVAVMDETPFTVAPENVEVLLSGNADAAIWIEAGFDAEPYQVSVVSTIDEGSTLAAAIAQGNQQGIASLEGFQTFGASTAYTCYRKFDRMLYYNTMEGSEVTVTNAPVDSSSVVGNWAPIRPPLRSYSYFNGKLWVSGDENPNTGVSYNYVNNNKGAGSIVYWGTSSASLTRMPDQTTWATVNQPLYFWFPAVYTATLSSGSGVDSTGSTRFHAVNNVGLFSDDACRTKATSITPPTKRNASFLGYYTQQNGGGTQVVAANGSILKDWSYFANDLKDDVTLYAHWAYTCQRQSDEALWFQEGGTGAVKQAQVGSADWSDASPAMVGYSYSNGVLTLRGSTGIDYSYYLTSSKGAHTAVYAGTSKTSLKRLSNCSYTALTAPMYFQFPGVYKVTLDAQGAKTVGTQSVWLMKGKGKYSTSTCTTLIGQITKPTKAGCGFGGYYSEKNGEGTCYVSSTGVFTSSFTTTAFSANTTLYAQWTKVDVYTITLDRQSGSGGTTTLYQWKGQGFYTDAECTQPVTKITIPTRVPSGRFLGYYEKANGDGSQCIGSDGAITASNDAFSSAVRLYAWWAFPCERQSDEDLWHTSEAPGAASKTQSGSDSWSKITPDPVGYSYSNGALTLKCADGHSYTYYRTSSKGAHTAVYAGTSKTSLKRLSNCSYTALTAPMYFQFPGVYKVTLDRKAAEGTESFYVMKGKGFYSNASCTTSLSKVTPPSATSGSYASGSFQGYYVQDGGAGALAINADGSFKASSSDFSTDMTLYALWAFSCFRQSDEALWYTRNTEGLHRHAQNGSDAWTVMSPAMVGYSYQDGVLMVKGSDGIEYRYYLAGKAKHVAVYAGASKDNLIRLRDTSYTNLAAPMYFQFPGAYRIDLQADGASDAGTTAIWELKGKGFFGDSSCVRELTEITLPVREAGSFYGYFTEQNGEGSPVVDEQGKIVALPNLFSSASTAKALWAFSCYRQSDEDLWYSDSRTGTTLYRAQEGSLQWSTLSPQMKGYSYQDGLLTLYAYTGVSYTYCLADGARHPVVRVGTSESDLSDLRETGYTALMEPLYFQFPGVYQVSFDAAGGTMETQSVVVTMGSDSYWDIASMMPERDGYAFVGWADDEGNLAWEAPGTAVGGEYWDASGPDARWKFRGDVSVRAEWTVIVSADTPLEVTARIDLLGVEEQVEATGWIESRSGGALEVVEVSFTPLAGATDLFGSRTADVFLEAFAEGSDFADYRFALNAAATESDASRLAPFALPDGYGTRIGVGYRFAIPDDVLASIDSGRFEQATTPVGQVVYTVALAS